MSTLQLSDFFVSLQKSFIIVYIPLHTQQVVIQKMQFVSQIAHPY
jgi:hypothetical protein